MEKTNIELFNEVSLRVLTSLYAKFPEHTHLTPASIGMLEDTSYQNSVGQMVYSDEWTKLDSFIRSTARWLTHEGYLIHRESHSNFWPTFTLSALGLKSLKNVEQPDIGQPTFGEKLKGESESAARAAASKFMDQFLAAGSAILLRATDLSV